MKGVITDSRYAYIGSTLVTTFKLCAIVLSYHKLHMYSLPCLSALPVLAQGL